MNNIIIDNKIEKITKNVFFYNYPVGILGIAEEDNAVTDIFFSEKKEIPEKIKAKNLNENFIINETSLIEKTALQLREYFDGKRKKFSLPLMPKGTDFQQSVWKALQTIPWGETRTYSEIASLAGNPKACRAAGMANNRNPIVIIIPCHRVIGKDNSLTGYGGGLENKKLLLDLEIIK